EQNKFDKEIIRVDERVNVFMMVLNGSLLKLFPEQGSVNNRWISLGDQAANIPLTGNLKILNDDLQLREFNYSNIFKLYAMELIDAGNSGDYSRPDQIVGYIHSIQQSGASSEFLPTETMVKLETYYNKAKIFIKLKNWYALLSVILLFLAFITHLQVKRSKILNRVMYVFIGLLAVAFLYHTYGMGLRWYLTKHAPWSNGYEALLLVAWGSLLAGFSFMRYSKITLAATALLAFFTLMTASHSSYDPQLTNLQPVLKSYWLIIHVASITISYGFLGIGLVLGLINIFIYLFKSRKNHIRLGLIIKELSYINEMGLTIGIFLATIGTFLGGVWANESWGRYWGWDAKETWALIIIIVYAIILHLRLIPKLRSLFLFNVASVFGFGSVIMTFIGVNYYLSKGLHSYASGDTPVFPVWAWITILLLLLLIVITGVKEKLSKYPEQDLP
ncbi:cytochrome c biogenesis protein, partial [Bacteroidota bacterium]